MCMRCFLFLLGQHDMTWGVLLGLCRHASQWVGASFMPQREYAGLCNGAESFQHLRELDFKDMRFSHAIRLPHGLQRVAFRNVYFLGPVRLDMCRCTAPTQDRGAGQLVECFLACAMLSE